MARKFTQEEKEILRMEWRRRNPEEAARREAKKNAAEQERLRKENEEIEQENYCFSALPRDEKAVEAYRKKISGLLEHITLKREQYVQDRNLEASRLSNDVRKDFIAYVSRNYDGHNQAIAGVICALLVEGLRYPDKELNSFSFNFLKDREIENPNWILWISIWSMEFVPLDAVRLMLKMENGSFQAIDTFRDLMRIVAPKVLWHLEQEYKRLEWSKKIDDPVIREREIARKTKRISYFKALIKAYE